MCSLTTVSTTIIITRRADYKLRDRVISRRYLPDRNCTRSGHVANVSKTVWTNCNIPYHGARSRAITTATASWLRLIASVYAVSYTARSFPIKWLESFENQRISPVDRFRKYRLLRGQVPRYSLIFINHPFPVGYTTFVRINSTIPSRLGDRCAQLDNNLYYVRPYGGD